MVEMRVQTEAHRATIDELAEKLASAQPAAAPTTFTGKEDEALHNRIHLAIEHLVGRGVSGNEQLGKGLSFTVHGLPSFVQELARELEKPPRVLWGGLPLPPDLSSFLSQTVRMFRAWVISKL